MEGAVHVIVDGGLDDALALGVLLALEVPLAQVIATEGSLDLVTTASTTQRLMTTYGSSVPVRLGTERGLDAPYPGGRDPFHGPDCFGGSACSLEPADVPTESFQSLDGPIFCSGALTVVALGMIEGHQISEVVWMGGAVTVGGNMTAAAEFNAWMDPEAADKVLASGTSVRMVPLDITERFNWSVTELDTLDSRGGLGSILAQSLRYVLNRDGVFFPHDAVAALAMTSPELFSWRTRSARCETAGILTRGETVVDRRRGAALGTVLIAEDVDVAEVSARILDAIGRLSS